MRIISYFILASLIALINTAQSFAQNSQYTCSVVHFLNSEGDKEFERINREKEFLIVFDNDRAFVKTICPSCDDNHIIFQLFHATNLGVYGVEFNGLGMRAISVNTMRGEATMSFHTPHKVTVWELACR